MRQNGEMDKRARVTRINEKSMVKERQENRIEKMHHHHVTTTVLHSGLGVLMVTSILHGENTTSTSVREEGG